MNEAAKKEVAEFNEQGEVVKYQFSISWTEDHFSYEGSVYACQTKAISENEAWTLDMLVNWADKFTIKVKKID